MPSGELGPAVYAGPTSEEKGKNMKYLECRRCGALVDSEDTRASLRGDLHREGLCSLKCMRRTNMATCPHGRLWPCSQCGHPRQGEAIVYPPLPTGQRQRLRMAIAAIYGGEYGSHIMWATSERSLRRRLKSRGLSIIAPNAALALARGN